MEGHSCIRTKVLAEDVSSDGTVQIFKLTVFRGWKDVQEYSDEQEEAWNKWCWSYWMWQSYQESLLFAISWWKKNKRRKKTRLFAGNMLLLKQHLNSMKRVHVAPCQMCGKETYMECQICKKHVCFKSGKSMSSLSCCIDFHDDLMYGLGFMDHVELFGIKNHSLRRLMRLR